MKARIELSDDTHVDIPESTDEQINELLLAVEDCITNGRALRLTANNAQTVINPRHIVKVVVQ